MGTAVVLGALVGILFIFPNASIMGAKSVNERDTEIIYQDTILEQAFQNGKFILESQGTNIEVAMSSEGFAANGNIVVRESATGISFNSLNRTLLQWTQTLYNNELYYRLKILEPSGMVFTDKPTTVYINLPHRTDDFKYDFVLQNHYSPVNFSFINDTDTNTDALLINNLVVDSAASVNVPYSENNSVNNIVINANKIQFNCEAKVLNNVLVKGENNTIKLGREELAGVAGNLTVTGKGNKVQGTSANKVIYNADNGSLNMSKTIGSLEVVTVTAPIKVGTVTGAVEMQTISGSLDADKIGGGLTFNAGSEDKPTATASLNVNNVTGESKVRNYGIGKIDLDNVNGAVDIISQEIDGGDINVAFAKNVSGHKVMIKGYDGNIKVTGINGGDVTVNVKGGASRAAFANIDMQFNQVGTAMLSTGAYPNGHDNQGNIKVTLGSSCNNLDIYVCNARSANAAAKYNVPGNELKKVKTDSGEFVDGVGQKNSIAFVEITDENRDQIQVGTLKINTQNKFTLA